MNTSRKLILFCVVGMLIGLWRAGHHSPHPKPHALPPMVIQENLTHSLVETPFQRSPSLDIPLARQITFQTDTVTGIIDKQRGDLVYLALRQYPTTTRQNNHSEPFVLLDQSLNRHYVAQSDVLAQGESPTQTVAPTYHSHQSHYELLPTQEILCIELQRKVDDIEIIKQFRFKKGKYLTDVHYRIHNQGQTAYHIQPYAQLTQRDTAHKKGWLSSNGNIKGVVSSDNKRYQKFALDRTGKQSLPQTTSEGWLSFTEPYFASAWISKLSNVSYYSYHYNNQNTLGMLGQTWKIAPNKTVEGTFSLYAGPKSTQTLAASAKHLELLVDYGFFWFVAKGLFWILNECQHWVGWGWSIVLLTIFLKVCFYPLSAKQFREMQVRRRLQPKIDALNTRYAHDKAQLAQATFAVHRKAGINPIGGGSLLLPLMQVPLFLALNAVLMESIELRHQPFLFWIKDLSSADPYYLLPLLAGFTMCLDLLIDQTVGFTATGDASNEALLFIMPTITTFFATQFSAGLVLYWITQNILSALQKWWLRGAALPNIRNKLLNE